MEENELIVEAAKSILVDHGVISLATGDIVSMGFEYETYDMSSLNSTTQRLPGKLIVKLDINWDSMTQEQIKELQNKIISKNIKVKLVEG